MYKKSKVLRAVRHELQGGNQLMIAQRRAGLKSPDTLYRWRKRSLIDRYILRCVELSENYRIVAVEDAQFKSAINGNTRAQETFLFNRAPNRWKKDNSDLQHKGTDVNVNVQMFPNKTIVFKDLGKEAKDDTGSDPARRGIV